MIARKRLGVVAIVAALALVAAACGDDGGAEPVTTTAAATTTTAGAPPTTSAAGQPDSGSTLAAIGARGELICGVNEILPGFGLRNSDGSFSGFDVDYCRALAAAVLGDADAVNFRALTTADRFAALQTGQIDVLIRNTTFTQKHDVAFGGHFGPTTFYDGQGIAAKASDGFDSSSTMADLAGSIICVSANTTTELNMIEAVGLAGIAGNTVVQALEDFDQVMAAFALGSCDAITTDKSGLIARKATAQPASFQSDIVIFGLTLSKEPLGLMYRADDPQWGDIVDWLVYATWIAEEKGITSSNIDRYLADNPNDFEAQRLFGSAEDTLNDEMGLSVDAYYNAIKQVGNYEEIYNRNLGPDTVFDVARGLNNLWFNGGLFYPPPAR